MKLFLFGSLHFASQVKSTFGQPVNISMLDACYSGPVKVAGGKNWTEADFLAGFWPKVVEAIVDTTNSDSEFDAFMRSAGNCQSECLKDMMENAMSTLYGKLGERLGTVHGGEEKECDSCGFEADSNIGWTGKETVSFVGADGGWQECCDECKAKASADPPCVAWVFIHDGHCYQKYDMGKPVTRLSTPDKAGSDSGVLSKVKCTPDEEAQSFTAEAFIGAWWACYPQAPQEASETIIDQLISKLTAPPPPLQVFPLGHQCLRDGMQADFPMDDCLTPFQGAFEDEVAMRPLGGPQTKQCQWTCIDYVIPRAFLNLWQNNIVDEQAGVDAITSAIHSCFPGVPIGYIRILVTESIVVCEAQEDTDNVEEVVTIPGRYFSIAEIFENVPPCHTGPIFVNGQEVSMEDVMNQTSATIGASVRNIMEKNDYVQQFFLSRGSCQFDCSEKVLDASFRAQYGKLAQEYATLSDETKFRLTEALEGSFSACFPAPPRKAMLEIAGAFIETTENRWRKEIDEREFVPLKRQRKFLKKSLQEKECVNEDKKGDYPLDDFKQAFIGAFADLMDSKKKYVKVKDYLLAHTKYCQAVCMDETITQALITGYKTNNRLRREAKISLTGAIHACYPGIPSPYMRGIVRKALRWMVRSNPDWFIDVEPIAPPNLPIGDIFQSLPECYTGDLFIGSEALTMESVMVMSQATMGEAIRDVIQSNPYVGQFFESRGDCQFACVDQVLNASFRSLYGRLGQEYATLSDSTRDVIVEALEGSFSACFPAPPRKANLAIADEFIKYCERNMKEEAATGQVQGTFRPIRKQKSFFKKSMKEKTCINAGKEAQYPLEDFKNAFIDTLADIMDSKTRYLEMKQYFQHSTKACQASCMQKTVSESLLTGFLTQNEVKREAKISLTGAIHACYPGIPSPYTRGIVKLALRAMAKRHPNYYEDHIDDEMAPSPGPPTPPAPTPYVGTNPVAAIPQCYTGDLFINYEPLPMEFVMDMSQSTIGQAINNVVTSNSYVQQFFSSRGDCQFDCVDRVLNESFRALYGKLGQEYATLSDETRNLIIEALEGSISACFPSPPRKANLAIAEAFIVSTEAHMAEASKLKVKQAGSAEMGDLEDSGESEFRPLRKQKTFRKKSLKQKTCINAGKENDYPLDDFKQAFLGALDEIMNSKNKYKDLKDYLLEETKGCQATCMERTISNALLTGFLTDNQVKRELKISLTGAIHACYPGIPSPYTRGLVKRALKAIKDTHPHYYITNIEGPDLNQPALPAPVPAPPAPAPPEPPSGKCYTGDLQVGGGMSLSMDLVMYLTEATMGESIKSVIDSNPYVQQFFTTRGDCQFFCVEQVMKESFKMLYGKLGQGYATLEAPSDRKLVVEALEGSFSACFPAPPRKANLAIAEAFIKRTDANMQEAAADLQGTGQVDIKDLPLSKQKTFLKKSLKPKTCINAGKESEYPLEDFKKAFIEAITELLDSKKKYDKLVTYLQDESKECQATCMEKTIGQALLTGFLTGNEVKREAKIALTGAIHACYPGIRSSYTRGIVARVLRAMRKVHPKYYMKNIDAPAPAPAPPHGVGKKKQIQSPAPALPPSPSPSPPSPSPGDIPPDAPLEQIIDAVPQCYTGDIFVNNHPFSMNETLEMSQATMGEAIRKVIDSNPYVKEFFASRGECQFTCADQVLTAAFASLYGKLGQEYATLSDETRALISETLEGSLSACFPAPPRKANLEIAEAFIKTTEEELYEEATGQVVDLDTNKFRPLNKQKSFQRKSLKAKVCINAGRESEYPLDEFKQAFFETLRDVMNSKKKYVELKNYLLHYTKDCQATCMEKTVTQALLTSFLTDNQLKREAKISLTGAIHACYPGIPSPYTRGLVKRALSAMTKAMKNSDYTYARKYDNEVPESVSSVSSISSFSITALTLLACAALVVFVARVAVRVHANFHASHRRFELAYGEPESDACELGRWQPPQESRVAREITSPME